MAYPHEVCTECFEEYGRNERKIPHLLESTCLEEEPHKCVTVRVRKENGVLQPEIRPIPKVHFKGEFGLCDPHKCSYIRRKKPCKFPHCLKEKAAWNAEKFGVLSPVNKNPTAPTPSIEGQTASDSTASKDDDEDKDPWPDFSGSWDPYSQVSTSEISKADHLLSSSSSTMSPPFDPQPSAAALNTDTQHRVPSSSVPWQPRPNIPDVPPHQPVLSYAQATSQRRPRSSNSWPASSYTIPQQRQLSTMALPPHQNFRAVPPSSQPRQLLPTASPPRPLEIRQMPSPPRPLEPRQMPSPPRPLEPRQMPSPPRPLEPRQMLPTASPPRPLEPRQMVPTALPPRPLEPRQMLPTALPPSPLEPRQMVPTALPPSPLEPRQMVPAALPSRPLEHRQPLPPSLQPGYPRQAHSRDAFPRKQSLVLQQPLTVENYLQKFHRLLVLEEEAHAKLLQERCDGKYVLALLQAGQTPGEVKVDVKPYHFRFGYIKGMGCDEVGYATQSASKAVIKVQRRDIQCDILRENMYHAEERLYIGFKKEVVQELLSLLSKEKSAFSTPGPLPVTFRLKYSYFKSLNHAVQNVEKYVISRLLPKHSGFSPSTKIEESIALSLQEHCSLDQYEALKAIASTPESGPPVLIAGPFGTGKTRVLAIAAHYYIQKSINKGGRLAILVCTQQHTSADAFLRMYHELTSKQEAVRVVRLRPTGTNAKDTFPKIGTVYQTVDAFRKVMERDSHRNQQRYLIVCTCLTARSIGSDPKILHPWFFTHIFLDEGAQMREPEAIAPLCLADRNTKLVIAGDRFQVGPGMLVLGEAPQKYGLAVSLLERLYDLYQELGEVAKPYCAHLSTNFRCHSAILGLAQQVVYKSPLSCEVPDHSAHPEATFPLRFVCTSLDSTVRATESSICEVEVNSALKEASWFLVKWPVNNWGKRDLRQMCFLSPCRGQVTLARNTRDKSIAPQVKLVQKLPTYLIQGQEFRGLFISTSEPTTSEGETRDSTKSISDPAVFITAITRARSLIVATGNPFMLLRREEHMVKKYGERGHCWSLFLKACIDNGTLSVYCECESSSTTLTLLEGEINKRVSHLRVPELRKAEIVETVPSLNIVPDTPTTLATQSTSVAQPSGEENIQSHEFKEYVLKEELGRGGFGVVFHVLHKIDKKEYALKIVRLRDKPERVLREVQALADLNHSNIVRYYHSWKERAPTNWQRFLPWKSLPNSDSASYPSERKTGESESQVEAPEASATSSPHVSSHSSEPASSEDNVIFEDSSSTTHHAYSLSPGGRVWHDPQPPVCLCIKTELCDSETLKTWLTKNIDSRTRVKVTTWFLELLDGVKYIHSKKLMHRDLKPSNIFFSLATTETEKKIKIGDFGLVTTSQVALSEGASPRSNYVGTSLYMSPEQMKKERYDNKVDIYALGVIFFEMNCPLATEAERCKVLSMLRTRGNFPSDFETNFPHEASIIQWMLAEDPKERPSADAIFASPRKKKLLKNAKKNKLPIPRL